MQTGAITGYIDVAQIVLYMFWVFFAGLIFYLRREDRREGYPLLSEIDGKPMNHGVIYFPPAKSFKLATGNVVIAPENRMDRRKISARALEPWTGAPLEPIGDPMLSEFGPGAYAERADVPDLTSHKQPRLAPMRAASGYEIALADPDPRGMKVYGADRGLAGTVTDVWVDRAEGLIRYLEVAVEGLGRSVLLPMTFASIDKLRRRVHVDALYPAHFANVPVPKSPDQVTLLEEDRICAYYGGGTLYAHPSRREPLL